MAVSAPYAERRGANPAYRAYQLLHIGFVAAPLIAGLDKFAHVLTDWTKYLSPLVSNAIPAQTFMYVVGGIEILAAVLVAFMPKFGAYVVAAWLGGIVLNLLSFPGYYDIALRDFGLMLGALALGQLANQFGSAPRT